MLLSCPRPLVAVVILCATVSLAPAVTLQAGTFVRFDTTLGVIDYQLFDGVMPRSVDNFLAYVSSGRYDESFVHRSARLADSGVGVIQGGGFYFENATGVSSVPAFAPINDEPGGGVDGPSNVRGTIAFAKGGPNTVTSQWFINIIDNTVLDDATDPNTGGFAAFGVVLNNGMVVADAIANLPRVNAGGPFNTLPTIDFTGGNLTEENFVFVDSATVFTPIAGDFNIDGTVDHTDLARLEDNFGRTSGAFFDNGDSDMDGDVDGADFLAWQRTKGQTSAAANVIAAPEPTSAILIGVGLGCVLVRRGRRR